MLEFCFWISCQIDLGVIYSSPSPFFEIAILFVDFFFASNNKILGSFGTFLAHYWRCFSQWLAKSIWEYFIHIVYVFVFNVTYWRANFEVAIPFSDFSLGSKSDILGSFGTFPAHIGGFFLNELANHFRRNLIFFFLYLRSMWPTGELILRSLSFSLTFFLFQKVTSQAVLAHF